MRTINKDSIVDWSVDRVFRTLIGTLRLMPYAQRVAAMDYIIRRGVGPKAGYRDRAIHHLHMVFPNLPEADTHHLADRSLGNVGRTLIELYSGAQFTRRMAQTEIYGPGLRSLEEARADNRPVMFVTGHFGNHEAPRHALVARGYQIGGLYRPMSNAFFNAHYAKTMTSIGGPVFAQSASGMMGFLRHLKEGGMATLLFDVWAAEGENIPFMGHPAATSLAAAKIAKRTDAVIIPYFGIRQPDGLGFDIELETPLDEADPYVMMQEATRRLEARIHTHPDQYFWIHRRWKPLLR